MKCQDGDDLIKEEGEEEPLVLEEIDEDEFLLDDFDIDDEEINGDIDDSLEFPFEFEDPSYLLEDSLAPPTDDADQIQLEKLPRPVSELNCRMTRSYLVKLLRAANGGQNPAYGNPDKKPPFWPDFYWPWTKLTDVHSKPVGMTEPLQYSIMMKLAISRGYAYYGYNPNTHVDPNVDLSEKQSRYVTQPKAPNEEDEIKTTLIPQKAPPVVTSQSIMPKILPKLPRPASKLNCVQARHILSRLLRFQQRGNNPVYGSPDTRPPWWPEDMIRWADMVDLRGKPKYLPDQRSFIEVLRMAIVNAVTYYGFDPETYVDNYEPTESAQGALGKRPMQSAEGSVPKSAASACENPPKLPLPAVNLTCSQIRTCLTKLLWFYNNKTPPMYGLVNSKPVWWPSHLIDWVKMKNIHHKYEGPLGNTYTNCLKSALILGYAYYGLDTNKYVENCDTSPSLNTPNDIPNQRLEPDPLFGEPLNEAAESVPSPLIPLPGNVALNDSDPISVTKMPPPLIPLRRNAHNYSSPIIRKIMPSPLTPLSRNVVLNYSNSIRMNHDSITKAASPKKRPLDEDFPPKLKNISYSGKPIPWSTSDVLNSLKRCKVDLLKREICPNGYVRMKSFKWKSVMDLFVEDRTKGRYVDLKISSCDQKSFWVHKDVLSAQSKLLKEILNESSDATHILFVDIGSQELKILINAVYSGEAYVDKDRWKPFLNALEIFKTYGLLKHLHRKTRNEICLGEEEGEEEENCNDPLAPNLPEPVVDELGVDNIKKEILYYT